MSLVKLVKFYDDEGFLCDIHFKFMQNDVTFATLNVSYKNCEIDWKFLVDVIKSPKYDPITFRLWEYSDSDLKYICEISVIDGMVIFEAKCAWLDGSIFDVSLPGPACVSAFKQLAKLAKR